MAHIRRFETGGLLEPREDYSLRNQHGSFAPRRGAGEENTGMQIIRIPQDKKKKKEKVVGNFFSAFRIEGIPKISDSSKNNNKKKLYPQSSKKQPQFLSTLLVSPFFPRGYFEGGVESYHSTFYVYMYFQSIVPSRTF